MHGPFSISEENEIPEDGIEVVGRAVDAWNGQGVDGLVEMLHPEVEWSPDPDWPEAGMSHGRDEVRGFLETFSDAWETVTLVIDQLDQVDQVGDLVLLQFRWLLRGRSSGVEQELPVSAVIETKEGLIATGKFFLDHGEAQRTAGLEPGA